MCRNRREEIMDEIRKHFPIQYIAKHILIGEDGVSREGYTTEFKRLIGKLLSQKTPPFIPSEIASILGVDARCVMLWESKYRRGHFDKDTPRDLNAKKGGTVSVVNHKSYRHIQTEELAKFAQEHHLTDEQFTHLSTAINADTDVTYKNFRESDGDAENLVEYFELLFLEHVTEPDTDFHSIKNVEEVVEEQPIAESIDVVQQRINILAMHWDAIRQIATLPLTMAHLRCYRLSHKPETPEDILISMDGMYEWKTKQNRNRAYGRLMDYCDGYVGPHVDKKTIPLTIRTKLSKQIVHLPDNTWLVIPVRIMQYIEKCRVDHTWDWDVLMSEDCPLPILDVKMRKASGMLYIASESDDENMLFGRPIEDINTWQYYVDIVRIVAPAAAIKIEKPVKVEEAPTLMSTPVSDDAMEDIATSVVQTLIEEKDIPSAIIPTPEEVQDTPEESEAPVAKVTTTPVFEIVECDDNSYDGMKYLIALNMVNCNALAIETLINQAVVALLRHATNEAYQFQNVVIVACDDNGDIRLTGTYPKLIQAPTTHVFNGTQLTLRPVNFVVGCNGNHMTIGDGSQTTEISYSQNCVYRNKTSMAIVLTTVNGIPLHIEFA